MSISPRFLRENIKWHEIREHNLKCLFIGCWRHHSRRCYSLLWYRTSFNRRWSCSRQRVQANWYRQRRYVVSGRIEPIPQGSSKFPLRFFFVKSTFSRNFMIFCRLKPCNKLVENKLNKPKKCSRTKTNLLKKFLAMKIKIRTATSHMRNFLDLSTTSCNFLLLC